MADSVNLDLGVSDVHIPGGGGSAKPKKAEKKDGKLKSITSKLGA